MVIVVLVDVDMVVGVVLVDVVVFAVEAVLVHTHTLT